MGKKNTVWKFQATNKKKLIQEDLDIALEKAKCQRKTEYLLIGA